MRKELVLLALLAMIAFIGCKGTETTPEDDEDRYEGEGCAIDEDSDYYEYDEGCYVPDDDVTCTGGLTDDFFDDMPAEWKAYFTLKMSGVINDPANEDPDFAFLTKIGVTLLATQYNLGDNYGMYMRDSVQDVDGNIYPAVLAVGVGNLTWPVTNKLASLWAGQTAILVEDLLGWKAEREAEGYGDVTISETAQVAVFEVWIEVTSTAQYTRMECIRGLSPLNGDETADDGKMYFCWDEYTEWAIGEQMKMMQYSKMIDDPAELLAALNEGLTSEDPEYRTDVCRCWEQDGVTPMDCEAMKDEFGIGELPDDDALLTDETPDDDVLISD